jgi:hypothetical protein
MKKALILCVALITSISSFAQETTTPAPATTTAPPVATPVAPEVIKPVRLGFAVAPAITWLTNETKGLESSGSRFGFSYGVIVDFTIGKSNNYALGTGFYISHTGGKLQYYDAQVRTIDGNSLLTSAYTDIAVKMQYIEVPFTLKLKTNQIGYMSYFGQFGVLGGIKLGAKQDGSLTYNNSPGEDTVIDNESYNDQTQLFNFGLLIGIGTEYNISGNTNLTFGIQYFRGFTNVIDKTLYQLDDNNDLVLDDTKPIPGSKATAMLNRVSLTIGVMF